ncbi:filamentous hemagglutinin N-terminal domain-containing protein [Paraburkholderia aspalathi]|uniref:two-partner secretion domain-containing protein n=1 Tax=Paraburkholderia nemoris TaxID=2793076 RepID=UPI00190D5F7B|nr:filamentous hemagglutinin N-terminal domain-containing protein [Paraburkholderia nemoris]MBK3744660.1 filamentous hemagglutinin N-terminal domain-containing protein [Paraburkholderia aspalathi]
MSSSERGSTAGRGSPRQRQFQIRLIVATFAAVPCSTYAIGISVGGGTVIAILTAEYGHQTVNIAPTVAGVSSNTCSSFNVDSAGSSPNDVDINAQAILNRVTGIHPSIISGSIDVVGPRADVILASPSGIAANGGSFAVKWARACSGFDVQNCCVDSGAITRST